MYIFKPWKKDVQSCMKKGLKLYKELRLQGIHCLYTFIKSEIRKWQSSQSGKVTKINSRIISKPHAHLKTMEKTCAKFKKKISIKLYEELRSQASHCLYAFIESEVRKCQSSQCGKSDKNYSKDYISKPYAHLQTMGETCAKFQKDRYKIAWGVALTMYPLSKHWGRKITKFTKWKKVTKNNLTNISK